MRQIGVGTPGGADPSAIFHQLLYDEWMLSGPLTRVKVDEKIYFGMIGLQALREAASRFHPKHTAAATWKHRNLSHVEQEGLPPMPKDRGAEKGDVDGPLECSLALEMVAAKTRRCAAAQQAAASHGLVWMIHERNSDCKKTTQPECRNQTTSSLAARRSLPVPSIRSIRCRKNGGLADLWYMDDGDVMCHPILVPFFLQEFDAANAKVVAERNHQKTEVIYCENNLDAALLEWRIRDVQNKAKLCTVSAGSITLGVAVGPRQYIADQLFGKVDVIRAMHERDQLCEDPQTEFSILRESMGVNRINHILRVHGHTILQEQRAAQIYDEVGQRSLERLFPGLMEDSMTQATLSAGVRNRIQKSARHRGSCTLESPHCRQAPHPSNDPR